MAPRFITLLTGRNLPKIRQPRKPEPSTVNEKTLGDFTRVVEETGEAWNGSCGPAPPPCRRPAILRPNPIAKAINGGFDLLEAMCNRCDRVSLVPLRALR